MPRPKNEILDELAAVSAELQRAEDLARQRDELVMEATRADASRSEVGKAAGVSRGRVQQIVTEARKEAETRKKRTQTGLAVVAIVAVGAGLLAVARDHGSEVPASPEAAPLSVSEIRESDASGQVQWLATLVTKNQRRSFEARHLRFICNGIGERQAREVSTLLNQPITADSLSSIDDGCPDNT